MHKTSVNAQILADADFDLELYGDDGTTRAFYGLLESGADLDEPEYHKYWFWIDPIVKYDVSSELEYIIGDDAKRWGTSSFRLSPYVGVNLDPADSGGAYYAYGKAFFDAQAQFPKSGYFVQIFDGDDGGDISINELRSLIDRATDALAFDERVAADSPLRADLELMVGSLELACDYMGRCRYYDSLQEAVSVARIAKKRSARRGSSCKRTF